MKRNHLCGLLGVQYPIIQAALPWVANAGLAAAVSEAGGLGLVSPSATMAEDDDMRDNLRRQIRQAKGRTRRPVGVGLYLGYPEIDDLAQITVEEGVRVVVTSGGSPALYTGFLKDNEVTVLHLVSSVRHARAAEINGVDVVVAEGYEGGGFRGVTEEPTFILLPQVVDAMDIPVVASGGITDARAFAAALCMGASGVHMGTRFVATTECPAHQRYKKALIKAVDSDTIVAFHDGIPVRLLRTEASAKLGKQVRKESEGATTRGPDLKYQQVRATMLEGDLTGGLAYCGAGVGMVNEVVPAAEVVQSLMQGAKQVLSQMSSGF